MLICVYTEKISIQQSITVYKEVVMGKGQWSLKYTLKKEDGSGCFSKVKEFLRAVDENSAREEAKTKWAGVINSHHGARASNPILMVEAETAL